ncbi:MAG: class I SAM-dependent methyltransferase, partial [Bradyrhizobiaceae bacterium]|nr:class I SAM-dependent methyltransferase [Bradyrhizobiaceae bacterium]
MASMLHASAARAQLEPSSVETFDATGKVVLGSIYNKPDPRAYWRTLSALDYRVPQEAKPYFLCCIAARRELMGASYFGTIVDLGCSYGINSMLLRFDLGIADLRYRYARPDIALLGRDSLIARDRRLEVCRDFLGVRFVGVDVSQHAAAYATEAGLLDDAIVADLEQRSLKPEEACRVADAALIISTGCFGYITEASLTRILQHCREQPWMAHTVLRMFDFAPAEEALARYGYVSSRSPRLLKQRRFDSRREQHRILDRLCSMGIDPSGLES